MGDAIPRRPGQQGISPREALARKEVRIELRGDNPNQSACRMILFSDSVYSTMRSITS